MKKRTMIFGLAGLLLLPLASVAAVCGDTTTRIESNGSGQTSGVSVSGEGRVSAAPDVANIALGVSSLAPTVAEAREQAAAALGAMIASMKANGVADKDIQTTQLNINPEYDYREGTSILRGFRVSNTVSAKLRDIDKTGEVVDDAVAAGGNNTQIEGIYFTIDDPTDLQEQARKAAVEDAKAKAEVLASAGGIEIGEPISISEGAFNIPPIYYSADRAAGAELQASAPTPIEPGELDVTVSVTVVWAIK